MDSSTTKRPCCTMAQLKILVDFMITNPKYVDGNFDNNKWAKLAESLSQHGPKKSVDQWKCSWRDLKSVVRRSKDKLLKATYSEDFLTDNIRLRLRVLSILERGDGETCRDHGHYPGVADLDGSQDLTQLPNFHDYVKKRCSNEAGSPAPERKRPRQSNFMVVKKGCDDPEDYLQLEPSELHEDVFSTVKTCFVNLIKNKLCSPTLFDDAQFRDVIALLPMTSREKELITSSYIQTCSDLDTSCDLDEDVITLATMDTNADSADNVIILDEDATFDIKVEDETPVCLLDKNADISMSRHTTDNTASENNTFVKLFEVSLDSAKCQICSKTLSWTDRATLKEHLQTSHPNTLLHDVGIENDGDSDEELINDLGIEEVFLEENYSDNEAQTKFSKKRRKKSMDHTNITGPVTRENIDASLKRLDSLDKFGPYVVSLLKSIPKDRCMEFQIEMVERLLREQAVAG